MKNVQAAILLIFSALLLTLSPHLRAEAFKLPTYETYVLPNGLKVYLMPQKEVPLLHVTVAIQSGSAADGNQYGLAALTGDALTLGTKNFSKVQLEELMDFHGASLGTAVNQDLSLVELSLAKKDAEQLLPVFAELVTAPTFPDKELTKLRERTVSELKKAKESPNQVADQFFNRLVFDKHPYGHPILGTPKSISKLERAKLQQFHAAFYRPQLAAISLVGDMDIPAMKQLIEKNFAAWAAGAAQPRPKPMSDPMQDKPSASRVLLVNKGDSRETTFRIGGLGIKRDDKDWVGIQVVNTILGGRFTSLLNEELRIKTGLTYGARSRFDAFKNAGTFAISSFTATENTEKTLELAVKTYSSFVETGVDEVTLESAKAYVKGQFPPRYETLDALSNLLVQMWAYDLSDAVINKFEADVNSLTIARANELIKTHFPAENMEILLIGQASKIQDIAKKYGRVIRTEIGAAQEGQL